MRVRKHISDYPTMELSYRNADYGFFAEFSYTRQRVSLSNVEVEETKGETKILQAIKANAFITKAELAILCNLSLSGVEWNIPNLLKHRVLICFGSTKKWLSADKRKIILQNTGQ